MNCGNCKHWSFGEDRNWLTEGATGIKKCQRIPMFWNATDWDRGANKRIFIVESKAFVQDGSDYRAELLTKPDFYCNMWEAK